MNRIEIVKFDAVKNPALFELALEIRTEVFVVGQNVPEEMELDEFDREAVHFLLYYNGVPVGTSRYRNAENRIKLERFAILHRFRNRGFGTKMVCFVLNALEDCSKEIYCHAQINAFSYWKRNGFQPFGDHFEEAGIEHISMRYQPENKS